MVRTQYPKEFKLEALKLVEQIGPLRAAKELGIAKSALYRWKQELVTSGDEAFRGHGRLTERDEELRKLRQENKTLKMEREILKKAAAFFANLHR